MPDYEEWFVNREKQYQGFLKMLARETPKTTMLVEAPAEMGKTWLIHKMRAHCRQRNVTAMHVDFRERRAHDYLSLVRLTRDQMGARYFNPLTEVINKFTSLDVNITLESTRPSGPVEVSVGDISDISGSEVIVAGGDVIKDNQFYIQADSEMARRAAEIRINDAFFACLGALLEKGPAVFLLDSYEDVTPEADCWLCEHLLFRMSEGQLPDALVIVAGRKTLDLGPAFKPLVAKTGLDLFSEEYVREYILERRGIEGLDLQTIIKTSGGFPGLLAKMADVATMDAQDDEEWL
jgi:hypothetical protein